VYNHNIPKETKREIEFIEDKVRQKHIDNVTHEFSIGDDTLSQVPDLGSTKAQETKVSKTLDLY